MHFISIFQNEDLVDNYLSKFLRGKNYNHDVVLKFLEEKTSFIACKCLGKKNTFEDSQVILSFQNGQSLSH